MVALVTCCARMKYLGLVLKKIRFDDSFDVTKCLQQIEIPRLLHMCAPRSELPPNISSMVQGNARSRW